MCWTVVMALRRWTGRARIDTKTMHSKKALDLVRYTRRELQKAALMANVDPGSIRFTIKREPEFFRDYVLLMVGYSKQHYSKRLGTDRVDVRFDEVPL
ncbi:hypothetical protein [Curtobacterium phage Parvaparticeps]|nr:hypothetical protein [Curtobacterium phage Parvaparticeps]